MCPWNSGFGGSKILALRRSHTALSLNRVLDQNNVDEREEFLRTRAANPS